MIKNYSNAIYSRNDRLVDFGDVNLIVYNNAASKD